MSCGSEQNQATTQIHWKIGMDTAQSGKKVIFEHADGLLCRICTMDVGWDKLKRNFVVAEVFFMVSGIRCT